MPFAYRSAGRHGVTIRSSRRRQGRRGWQGEWMRSPRPSRLPGIYFQLDYRAPGYSERDHGGASPRLPLPCRLTSLRPADNADNPLLVYIAALLPRQSSHDNANNGRGRTGVTHAPLNIVADKGAGDVLQTAIRHAPHPPLVKTFRTIAAIAAAAVAGVPRSWGKSRAALRLPRNDSGKLPSAVAAVFGNASVVERERRAVVLSREGMLEKTTLRVSHV